ncbi:hypothetical protein [uncultured Dysosmobacter sp.]|uniref:hypothetical protein n=1 Tax=uncultured Dysosmobacter sp. TaxID=2591384 RepID=UPI00261E2301|nr:hypothetical protein [uncultured Dysosmobacter sp.]
MITMDYGATLQALRRLKVETESLACLSCGYEHNCSVHGCAVLRNAVEHMETALDRCDHWSALLDQQEEAINYLERCADGLDPDFDNAVSLAIAALRTQQEAEKGEPLTLEELREMDRFSPPVWDDCLHDWCAVRPDVCAGRQGVQYIGGGCRPLEEGRFYRHKPKEETT